MAEAEQHAGEDKKRRELVDKRNQADGLLHATEKSLAEYGEKIESSEKAAIEEAIAALREAISGEDVAAMETASTKLQEVAMKLGEAMYKEQAEAAGTETGDGGSGEAKSEDADATVVDADFEEVKEDDRPSQ